jgi:heme O synthase-like polyprenyltransferase
LATTTSKGVKVFGVLLIVVGGVLLLGGVVIGVPFTGVYLMGFIGTAGREAGRELFALSLLTLSALAVALLLIKAGRALRR